MFQMSKWVMRSHFRHLRFNSFSMVWRTLWAIEFWPLQSFSEHSGVHQDSNSQHGSSLGSVRVLSPHILLHSRGHENATFGFSLGPHSCKPFALIASPRLWLQHFWLVHLNKMTFFEYLVNVAFSQIWPKVNLLSQNGHGCSQMRHIVN
jgi:hypothetical protein